MSTLVIQSSQPLAKSHWLETCMSTVRQWSQQKGYDYRFVGDEIFSHVPHWYLSKVGQKKPVATDYARLILLEQALSTEGYDRAIWFDADMLIIDQSMALEFPGTCAFGQELWIQKKKDDTKYRAVKNVHNAVCIFNQQCPVLPFLIQTVASIIQRVDPDKISPQMVGPKLLTALHSIAGFSLLPQVGALSPDVINDLVNGGGKALALLRTKSQVAPFMPPQAVNLCASLVDSTKAEDCIAILLDQGHV